MSENFSQSKTNRCHVREVVQNFPMRSVDINYIKKMEIMFNIQNKIIIY